MFDKILLNPPYNRSFHLKVLQEAMKHSDDVVNLSPIRWLQDPLAEYKKNSDWKKFEDIRKHIESLDVVSAKDAANVFNAEMIMDLGVYHITDKEHNKDFFRNPLIEKVYKQIKVTLYDKLEKNIQDGWRCRIQKISPVPSNRMNSSSGQARQNTLCHHSLDWVYKDGFNKEGLHWSENKLAGAGGPKSYTKEDKLPYSIKFDTEEEAYNFQSYTKTKFFKYIYSIMKTDQNVPLKYLPFMPTYTHPWTDEMLYEYFGLTPKQVNTIEEEIK